jgi:hypothetical protein
MLWGEPNEQKEFTNNPKQGDIAMLNFNLDWLSNRFKFMSCLVFKLNIRVLFNIFATFKYILIQKLPSSPKGQAFP